MLQSRNKINNISIKFFVIVCVCKFNQLFSYIQIFIKNMIYNENNNNSETKTIMELNATYAFIFICFINSVLLYAVGFLKNI